MATQAPQPSLSEDKYVALVSGLGLGDDAADPLRMSLLVDYLVGSLASDEEQTRVSKVIFSLMSICYRVTVLSAVSCHQALLLDPLQEAQQTQYCVLFCHTPLPLQ